MIEENKQIKALKIQDPETVFLNLYNKIPSYIKLTFVSTIVLGLIVHLYGFTDKFYNLDDMAAILGTGYGAQSGRFLLPVFAKLSGNYSVPWLNGFLSLVIMAFSSCLIVTMLRIRKPLGCIVASAFIISFPSVTANFLYMFTADAYCFSLLFAVLAAYLANRYKLGFIASIACICASLGIYQSFFPSCAYLMVFTLVLDVLDNEMSLKDIIFKGIKFVITLALGLIAYFVMVKITTPPIGITSYMGLSNMGQINIGNLPFQLSKALGGFYYYFVGKFEDFSFSISEYLIAFSLFITIVAGFVLTLSRKLKISKFLLLVFLVICLPISSGLIYLMGSDYVHDLMIFPYALVPLSLLGLLSYYNEKFKPEGLNNKKLFGIVANYVVLFSLIITSFGLYIFANKVYLQAELNTNQVYAYSNRLIYFIEHNELYSKDQTIILLSDFENPAIEPFGEGTPSIIGLANADTLLRVYSYNVFLSFFNGLTNELHDTQSVLCMKYKDVPELEALPPYPNKDCITIYDGYLIVKI